MPNIGAPGYILLIILALLLFGPNKLPELGRAVGRTFREFKNGARDILSEDERTGRKESKDSVVQATQTTSSEVQPQPEDKRLS
ncbi:MULTISPECIES: twin-arginine translocase TatA/TatE family subunit [Paenibacillus]|uniref:twin-arginine translocase TatA/TatE family subunit n=1 Tax=Paenibacillus TaxID=44249 RepID=UPI0005CE1893|nr:MULTISPECIES: twin-arginine translocase TatA/TatE family subunit [Paenibacillus]KAF6618314.1 twin-arginine translocase TatA/TatE family subunit [Paenibacillus sp. EKM101P]KAF6624660.1 twin-arginine translocase TatA/TatE family subunit [Paenibacillus sp. EKM102P]KAF6635561.1 twin-arginine translocase TatA/TatE family subunit [Paenibacillus sp. EKM10P]KAF6648729.1 twin-arginine translocase TatA/TatE family subunit [Paenibacillus sp. EKM11P]KJD40802.1 translocase [Paenibacillus polymyxa]